MSSYIRSEIMFYGPQKRRRKTKFLTVTDDIRPQMQNLNTSTH